jgi:5-methylcytosine-specific restriction endonuclease McrA
MHNYLPYEKIKHGLIGMNGSERYRLLLQTQEWQNFRARVTFRDSSACVGCGRKDGQRIEEQIYYEDYDKLIAEVDKRNNDFKLLVKEQPQRFMNILMGLEEGPMGLERYPPKTRLLETISLEVHHHFYIQGKLPWQYKLQDLTSLCRKCHEKVHRGTKLIFYTDDSKTNPQTVDNCNRCSGTGYIPEYNHVENGICFECGGLGIKY